MYNEQSTTKAKFVKLQIWYVFVPQCTPELLLFTVKDLFHMRYAHST